MLRYGYSISYFSLQEKTRGKKMFEIPFIYAILGKGYIGSA